MQQILSLFRESLFDLAKSRRRPSH